MMLGWVWIRDSLCICMCVYRIKVSQCIGSRSLLSALGLLLLLLKQERRKDA